MYKKLSSGRRHLVNITVLVLYAALLLVLLSRHEPFRDEAQQWLLARDLSVPDLIRQMSYEGHPCMWYLILMPFAKAGLPFGFAGYISITLILIAVAVLLWKGPMGLGWKLLAMLTSSFLFFGAVIGRSYSTIPLLLVLNACLYPQRHGKALRYGLTIALLVQTHMVMMGFAASLCIVWLWEAFANYRKNRDAKELMHQASGLLLPLISALFFLYQMRGSMDSSAMKPDFSLNIVLVIRMVRRFAGFFLANSDLMSGLFALLGLGAVLIAGGLMLCRKEYESLKPLAVVTAGIVISWLFSVFIYYLTEHSRMVICYLAVWFLWVSVPQVRRKSVKIAMYALYTAICLAWLLGNANGIVKDWNGSYSDMEGCAAFIAENLEEDDIIIGSNACLSAGVVVYLEDHSIYSRRTGEKMTYCDYRKREMAISSYEALIEWLKEVKPDARKVYFMNDSDEDLMKVIDFGSHADRMECIYRTDNNAVSDRYALYSLELT